LAIIAQNMNPIKSKINTLNKRLKEIMKLHIIEGSDVI